ncbi:MAG: metallophosphoesterase [Candidatus Heimdallarchaeota archaeon]|nr:metallophosphoesterase [Candidatus Heimdallarchaeota archaeon]
MSWSFEADLIEISNLSIPVSRLPAEFDGYRLTHLSDFHLGTWLDSQAIFEIVEKVNALGSDLIAITGDFVSSKVDQHAPDLIRALTRLKSRDGVFAVLGNHDHYTDSEKIREILDRSGVVELRNKVHAIKRDGEYLYIAGIDDQMTGHDQLKKVIDILPEKEVPVILLAHAPDFADISSKSGKFDLQLSGHTHGGQIRLPLIGPLYLPRLGRKYPSGEYKIGNMVLYTNRGLGTSWFKLRYNCPPEIAVFEFHLDQI